VCQPAVGADHVGLGRGRYAPIVPDERDRPVPEPDPSGPRPASGAPPAIGARVARRRRRRRRLVAAGIAATAVVGAGIVATVLALGSDSHRATPAAHRTHVAASTVPTTVTSAPPATSAVPRSSNPVVVLAQQYDGLYVGTFTNTTFNTTGSASLEVRIDPTAGTLHVTLNLTGDLFGGGAKGVRHIDGTVILSTPNAPVTMQTDAFGTVTGRLNGTSLMLTAANVPDAHVKTFELDGSLRADLKGFDATFRVGFRDGRIGEGTASVLCSVTGQRPSQVPTLCGSA
jgi:hypothetical protein